MWRHYNIANVPIKIMTKIRLSGNIMRKHHLVTQIRNDYDRFFSNFQRVKKYNTLTSQWNEYDLSLAQYDTVDNNKCQHVIRFWSYIVATVLQWLFELISIHTYFNNLFQYSMWLKFEVAEADFLVLCNLSPAETYRCQRDLNTNHSSFSLGLVCCRDLQWYFRQARWSHHTSL